MKAEPVKTSTLPAAGDGARARPASAAQAGPAAQPAGPSVPSRPDPAAAAAAAAEAVAEANRRLAEKSSELTIEFDDVLDRMIFRLVDSKTGEIVRQIPSEEVLAIARALADDLSSGVLLRTDA